MTYFKTFLIQYLHETLHVLTTESETANLCTIATDTAENCGMIY